MADKKPVFTAPGLPDANPAASRPGELPPVAPPAPGAAEHERPAPPPAFENPGKEPEGLIRVPRPSEIDDPSPFSAPAGAEPGFSGQAGEAGGRRPAPGARALELGDKTATAGGSATFRAKNGSGKDGAGGVADGSGNSGSAGGNGGNLGNLGKGGNSGSGGNGLFRTLTANPVLTRCLSIAVFTLLLLVPLSYFTELVRERSALHEEAIDNIAMRWGKSQTLSGPALFIPYIVRDGHNGGSTGGTRYMVLLPGKLRYSTELEPENRYKGIYHYVVYKAPVTIEGSFELPDSGPFQDSRNLFIWDQAFFSVGVTDLKAITDMGTLTWDGGEAAAFTSSPQGSVLLGPCFQARVKTRPDQGEYSFSMRVDVNGSGGVYFTPVGEMTDISVSGKWSAPNFDGDVLASRRNIDAERFSAQWSIPHVSRSYPQYGDLESYQGYGRGRQSIDAFVAGVSLYESMPLYRQITRAVKYGLLFIGLTYVALLSFELVSRRQLHLVQYALVGVAMCLFYLVLLSFAEHISFWQAFSLASAVSVLMNGLYITAALRSKLKGLFISALLICLYAVLYTLLQLEGYAMLFGTILVLFMVCVLMYLTRNLNRRHAYAQDDPAAAESSPAQDKEQDEPEAPDERAEAVASDLADGALPGAEPPASALDAADPSASLPDDGPSSEAGATARAREETPPAKKRAAAAPEQKRDGKQEKK
ncbi:inner membrane CreD family protein [Desulfovibrio sp. OttesenSCG-928-A18]|nr:inner membrane CreD family protein [Desulfovibrio sp. OttesenSCG-928-A18]